MTTINNTSFSVPQPVSKIRIYIGALILVVLATFRFRSGQDLDTFQGLLVAFGGAVTASISLVSVWRISPSEGSNSETSRDYLIAAVHKRWITGVLYRVLDRIGAMESTVLNADDAVKNRRLVKGIQVSRASSEIMCIFRDRRQSLVILGDENSGKTVLLLQLAESLLEQANKDETLPVPVVLSLATWGTPASDKPFRDWLASELSRSYDLSRAQFHAWLETGQLVLLLDDLDAVAQNSQKDCIEAINHHVQTYEPRIAVCCCQTAYDNIGVKLALDGAIALQPLTLEQVSNFLYRSDLIGLFEVWRQNPSLSKELRQPTLLNLAAFAYYQQTTSALTLSPNEERFSHVIAKFIQGVVSRDKDAEFALPQVKAYLRWLVKYLADHVLLGLNQNHLKHKWLLRDRSQRVRYAVGDLILLVVAGVVIWALAGSGTALLIVLAWLLIDIWDYARGAPVWIEDLPFWSQREPRMGLVIGGILGLVIGALAEPALGVRLGIFSGLSFYSGVLLLSGLLAVSTSDKSTTSLAGSMRRIWIAPQMAPVIGMAFTTSLILIAAFTPDTIFAGMDEFIQTTIGAFIFGTLLAPGAIYFRWYWLMRFAWGRDAEIKLPYRYQRFLEYAVHQQLLRKVGSEYRFRHQLVQQHFSS